MGTLFRNLILMNLSLILSLCSRVLRGAIRGFSEVLGPRHGADTPLDRNVLSENPAKIMLNTSC